ncbi:hypothetical protein CP533_2417, partial [Ophiocordyceps camponoti-saundersi (nom. inval.)]
GKRPDKHKRQPRYATRPKALPSPKHSNKNLTSYLASPRFLPLKLDPEERAQPGLCDTWAPPLPSPPTHRHMQYRSIGTTLKAASPPLPCLFEPAV